MGTKNIGIKYDIIIRKLATAYVEKVNSLNACQWISSREGFGVGDGVAMKSKVRAVRQHAS
jgi:hypothetical protein